MISKRTNVVIILADDLGYSDLGCYGSEIHTPTLDGLASRGVRASNFYNAARCSPARASLLTGMHPHQTGIGVLTRPDAPEGYDGTLSTQIPTVAEILRESGWRTWMSGKWHLASDTRTPNDAWPTRRGFERFFGTLAGCSSYFNPQTLTDGEEAASDALDDPDFYYTDAIADRAVEWITEHSASKDDAPFLLYLPFTAPHWPLHAREEDIQRYSGRYDGGWDELRRERLSRLQAQGLISAATGLSERDPSQPAWEDESNRAWQARRMEVYAAQVESMDRAIGRVVDAINSAGELDNTLILFLADNGAAAEELPIGELRDFVRKDQALRAPTRDGEQIRIGNLPQISPGTEDTYSSYGVPWANLSNTPFRLYKRWVHEGGIATPLIVHWPAGHIGAGTIAHEPGQLVDILPTVMDALGITSARSEHELPGRSLLRAWEEDAPQSETPLYWEHIGNCAIRVGSWKLVRDYPANWELYNLDHDRAELTDLAATHPQKVAELAALWEAWASEVGVIPWDQMLDLYARRRLPLALAEE